MKNKRNEIGRFATWLVEIGITSKLHNRFFSNKRHYKAKIPLFHNVNTSEYRRKPCKISKSGKKGVSIFAPNYFCGPLSTNH